MTMAPIKRRDSVKSQLAEKPFTKKKKNCSESHWRPQTAWERRNLRHVRLVVSKERSRGWSIVLHAGLGLRVLTHLLQLAQCSFHALTAMW